MVVTSDNPIRRVEDDVLNRATSTQSFARQVLELDASEGLVVGVLGAWGSGKTSFVNLARLEFENMGVNLLDFNPWMFSGAEQLVNSFFSELTAQLKLKRGLADVGRSLEEYGEVFAGLAWLPVVGPWIEGGRGLNRILSRLLQRKREGVSGKHAKVKKALEGLEKPIVVVIDDIDRLSTSEIRDMFKLVRLTASFPNIIYVLAFDRARVEEALAEQGIPGRSYLEKILQIAVDLPAIPESVLTTQVLLAIDDALAGIEKPGPFDQQVWPDIFIEIVRPLIQNMRDVRRYAAAIPGTVQSLDGQIALADVLALEAVRIFLPNVFQGINSVIEGLTQTSDYSSFRQHEEDLKNKVDTFINLAKIQTHKDLVKAMLERLFPAGQRHIRNMNYGGDWKRTWLKNRRVAHKDILRLYLEGTASTKLQAFTNAEQAWAVLADQDALESCLRSVEVERLQDVIASIETYEDEFEPKHVIPGTTVLLNLLPDLPERPRSMFELDARMIVTRVAYRLLRSQKDSTALEEAIRSIFPNLTTLSSKLELINTVGYRESVGHELISEEATALFENEWRSEVRKSLAEVSDFSKEFDLFRVLLLAQREKGAEESRLDIPDTPSLTLALLRSAKSESTSQTSGSRAVRRSSQLAWNALVELFDNEVILKERIEKLEVIALEDEAELIELAKQYLSGWRPKNVDDD